MPLLEKHCFIMKNTTRHNAWGSYDGFQKYAHIQQALDKPSAEYWMGDHPNDPSYLMFSDGTSLPLDKLIRTNPKAFLGEEVFRQFGDLPFLFKVLSASMPLSIQVHPDKAKAKAGFEREEARGIGLTAPERNYKDKNHKPELAVALSDFRALCGFRPAQETARLLGPELTAFFSFSADAFLDSLIRLLKKALSLHDHEKYQLEAMALKQAETLRQSSNRADRLAGDAVQECYRHYPHDGGAVSPLFLNLFSLEPGQGLYVSAGVMHAYLSGTILEIMATSDNVIRGGLTQKHIDVDDLIAVIDFAAQPELIQPVTKNAWKIWNTEAHEFTLMEFSAVQQGRTSWSVTGPEILFCNQGSFQIECPAGSASLVEGTSVFIAGSCKNCTLAGTGVAYRAMVPLQKDQP